MEAFRFESVAQSWGLHDGILVGAAARGERRAGFGH
jgi:hypothetical protein